MVISYQLQSPHSPTLSHHTYSPFTIILGKIISFAGTQFCTSLFSSNMVSSTEPFSEGSVLRQSVCDIWRGRWGPRAGDNHPWKDDYKGVGLFLRSQSLKWFPSQDEEMKKVCDVIWCVVWFPHLSILSIFRWECVISSFNIHYFSFLFFFMGSEKILQICGMTEWEGFLCFFFSFLFKSIVSKKLNTLIVKNSCAVIIIIIGTCQWFVQLITKPKKSGAASTTLSHNPIR